MRIGLFCLLGACGVDERPDALRDATVDLDTVDAMVLAPPSTGDADPPDSTPERRCNGAAHLCARAYDEVSYVTTHNAMSSDERRWLAPNQGYAVPQQLSDGVRGLMLDLHVGPDGTSQLCHGDCAFGAQPLVEGLSEIVTFLRDNPHEVITLIFESYITPAALDDALNASGVSPLAYTHSRGDPWPTLDQLVTWDRRIVLLSDVRADPTAYPEQLYVWDHAFETHYSAETPEDLDCTPNRGDPNHPLFILNHFLTAPLALQHLAEQINFNPSFLERARRCWRESGRRPHFVTVDFYEIGDVVAVVEALNAP